MQGTLIKSKMVFAKIHLQSTSKVRLNWYETEHVSNPAISQWAPIIILNIILNIDPFHNVRVTFERSSYIKIVFHKY